MSVLAAVFIDGRPREHPPWYPIGRNGLRKDNSNDRCAGRVISRSVKTPVVDVCEVRMAQERRKADNEVTASGLLLSVEPLTAAVDRGKANGAVADNDGND